METVYIRSSVYKLWEQKAERPFCRQRLDVIRICGVDTKGKGMNIVNNSFANNDILELFTDMSRSFFPVLFKHGSLY